MEVYTRKYLLWVLIINFIYSQEINRCSTDEYYLAKGIFSLSDLPIVNSDEELTIWIRAHIVRQNNGSGGISLSDIETMYYSYSSENGNLVFRKYETEPLVIATSVNDNSGVWNAKDSRKPITA